MSDESVDAFTCLKSFKAAADAFAESAAAYLELMAAEPRCRPIVGVYYQTFNGSCVHVARRRHECRCAACVAHRRGEAKFAIGPFLVPVPPETQRIHSDPVVDEYVVSVLRGGHGLDGYAGDEPGSAYHVGPEGLSLCPPVRPADTLLAACQLAVAGMSLRRLLNPPYGGLSCSF